LRFCSGLEFRFLSFAFLFVWLLPMDASAGDKDFHAYDLRCEYAVNPLGVDVASPHFSWKLQSETHGERQTAWQIVVASSPEQLGREYGDLWDSGKIKSDEQTRILYSGKMFSSSQAAFWKVRVWNQDDEASDWSAPATFTMGVLNPTDWRANWIESPASCPTLLLRRKFIIKPGLKRAIVHVCGLGQYELTINGRKSGDDLLSPGWTKYDRTCLYDTRDLTTMLREGKNVIGLELGNGMYNVTGGRYVKFKGSFGPLKAIAQIEVEYLNGSVETIVTDQNWRALAGPITFSCVYGGEDYDARLEPNGWNKPDFDDASWMVARVTDGPGGKLCGLSCAAPPIRTFETFTPISANTISNGVTVYDLGQNASFMPRLVVRGPAGSSVRIIPAELVKPDGSVDRSSVSGGRPAWWQYTLKGQGTETWFPKFFYHGSRYFQVELRAGTNRTELPELESIAGVVVHSASEPVGEFECSNDLFNRIRQLVRWAQRSNLASVLTDCPHRERLGWLEQYHLNGPSLRYEFDLNRMFTKGMNDMEDSQLPNGCVPSIAPEYTIFGKGPDDVSNAFRNSPEWGSAIVIVPWQQYEFTGDRSLLRCHYEAMKRYVAYLTSTATNEIVSFGLGDWYDLGPKAPGFAQLTPRALTATAFYFYDTHILAETARLLGETQDAERFKTAAEKIRAAFNQEFFNPLSGSYSTGSQCANAIPLVMSLVEPENRSNVLAAIVEDVRSHGNAVTAGDIGYRYLLRALAEGGRSDVIFDLNNQTDKPGYGYQLKHGATSLTEAWDARRSSSQNHFMLGQIMEWFYRDVAGIGFDPGAPGFKNVLIQPQPVGDLTWAKASYETIRGPVITAWKRSENKFTLEISIPPNTTATVFVPGHGAKLVNPKGVETAQWVRLISDSDNESIFTTKSGRYIFESEM